MLRGVEEVVPLFWIDWDIGLLNTVMRDEEPYPPRAGPVITEHSESRPEGQ